MQKLPAWTRETCTVLYIPLIQDNIKALYDDLQNRKKLVQALQSTFPGS